jgi:outer membrane protein OmpA-like peptidoglycan-associated protein
MATQVVQQERVTTGEREQMQSERALQLQCWARQRLVRRRASGQRKYNAAVKLQGRARVRDAQKEAGARRKIIIVRAIVRMQAIYRKQKARRAMVAYAEEKGVLLAMPGTVGGQSGWYEYTEEGEEMIAKFDVGCETGQWMLLEGPMKRRLWRTANKIKRRQNAKIAHHRVRRLSQASMTVVRVFSNFKAACRRKGQRQMAARLALLHSQGHALVATTAGGDGGGAVATGGDEQHPLFTPMEGTIDGEGGWYAFHIDHVIDDGAGAGTVGTADVDCQRCGCVHCFCPAGEDDGAVVAGAGGAAADDSTKLVAKFRIRYCDEAELRRRVQKVRESESTRKEGTIDGEGTEQEEEAKEEEDEYGNEEWEDDEYEAKKKDSGTAESGERGEVGDKVGREAMERMQDAILERIRPVLLELDLPNMQIHIQERIKFAAGTADIKDDETVGELAKVCATMEEVMRQEEGQEGLLKEEQTVHLRVESHVRSTKNIENGWRLSTERAQAVCARVSALAAAPLTTVILHPVGCGASKPLSSSSESRRVEIYVMTDDEVAAELLGEDGDDSKQRAKKARTAAKRVKNEAIHNRTRQLQAAELRTEKSRHASDVKLWELVIDPLPHNFYASVTAGHKVATESEEGSTLDGITGEEDDSKGTVTLAQLDGVTLLQSRYRGWQGRHQAVQQAETRGMLLALPGSTGGESGWYEWIEDRERLAAQFSIDEEHTWDLVEGPMKLERYHELYFKGELRVKPLRRMQADSQMGQEGGSADQERGGASTEAKQHKIGTGGGATTAAASTSTGVPRRMTQQQQDVRRRKSQSALALTEADLDKLNSASLIHFR